MENKLSKQSQVIEILRELDSVKKKRDTSELIRSLNTAVALNPKEIECFHEPSGLLTILRCIKESNWTSNSCIRILFNAMKHDMKVKNLLLSSRIFSQLLLHLQINHAKLTTIALHTSLIIILVDQDVDAQNRIREWGCLARLLTALNFSLDGTRTKMINKKNELLVYAIMACIRHPWNIPNQSAVGCIIPKILQTFHRNVQFTSDLKYLWSFLGYILHRNKLNQRIFLGSNGSSIMLRNLEELAPTDRDIRLIDFDSIRKITAILVFFKSEKAVLKEAADGKVITLLCRLLETKNLYIIRNILRFLVNLTEEVPQTIGILQAINGNQIIENAIITVMKSFGTITIHNLLTKLTSREMNSSNIEDEQLTTTHQMQREIVNHYHHVDQKDFKRTFRGRQQIYSKKHEPFLHRLQTGVTRKRFYRKELREKERKLRQIIETSVLADITLGSESTKKVITSSLIVRMIKTPSLILRKCLSYFSNKKKSNYFLSIKQAHEEILQQK